MYKSACAVILSVLLFSPTAYAATKEEAQQYVDTHRLCNATFEEVDADVRGYVQQIDLYKMVKQMDPSIPKQVIEEMATEMWKCMKAKEIVNQP